MVVGRAIFCTTILIAIPINTPPFRNSVAKFFFKKDELTKRMHVLMTIGLLLSTMGLAIVYPNITLVFNFLGGFNSTILVILIPGLLHYRVSNKSWKAPSNIVVLGISVILTLAGFTAVIIYTFGLE
jgi:amino acid permease